MRMNLGGVESAEVAFILILMRMKMKSVISVQTLTDKKYETKLQ